MSVADTLEFVLGCYDFDGSGRLTIDEITLAFKSTVTGMCKLEGDGGLKSCPRDNEFEAAAIHAFDRRQGPDRFKVKVCQQVHQSKIMCCSFSAVNKHILLVYGTLVPAQLLTPYKRSSDGRELVGSRVKVRWQALPPSHTGYLCLFAVLRWWHNHQ